jgi:hypothetical protein
VTINVVIAVSCGKHSLEEWACKPYASVFHAWWDTTMFHNVVQYLSCLKLLWWFFEQSCLLIMRMWTSVLCKHNYGVLMMLFLFGLIDLEFKYVCNLYY